jgi:biopolymer transport protein ExbB/TolQ
VGTTTPPVEVHTVVVGGMPGWQIALIAVVAALFAATAAVLADRSRSARRKAIAATA